MRPTTIAAAGGVLGALAGAAIAGLAPRSRAAVAGRGLVVAAGVYLLSRRLRGTSRSELEREVGALAATSALAIMAPRMPDARARALLAAGWIAHAGFDLVHRRGDGSVLPDWYPPLCVGFDIALAVTLLVPGRAP